MTDETEARRLGAPAAREADLRCGARRYSADLLRDAEILLRAGRTGNQVAQMLALDRLVLDRRRQRRIDSMACSNLQTRPRGRWDMTARSAIRGSERWRRD